MSNNTFIYGIIGSLLGSIGSSIGLLIQKKANIIQDIKIKTNQKPYTNFYGIVLSPLWFFGFLLLSIVPFPADYIAYLYAPQSLITPLGSATIIFTILFAPIITKEKVYWYNILSVIIICIGCVMTSIYGNQESVIYTFDEFNIFWLSSIFLVSLGIYTIICIICFICIYKWKYEKEILYAYISCYFGSLQNVIFKSITNFVSHNNFLYPFWISLLFMGILSFLQLSWLNKGLGKFNSVIMLPTYNAILIITSTILGSIFYEEYLNQPIIHLIVFSTGCIITCIGISIPILLYSSK